MASENNLADADKPANENVQDNPPKTDVGSPEPLKTYEQVNTNAPVVTQNLIQERLARKRAQAGAAKDGVTPATPVEGAATGDAGAGNAPRYGRDRRGTDGGEKGDRPRRFGDRRNRDAEAPKKEPVQLRVTRTVELPNFRDKSEAFDAEVEEIFQGNPLDEVMDKAGSIAGTELLEEATKVTCTVDRIQRDDVYVNLGTLEQGVIPLKQFPEDAPPKVGDVVEGVVNKFNKEENVYEISLPLAAAEVGDWSSLSKGLIVDARITGVNKGGLECEVGKIRAFMPMGQVQKFRVEEKDMEQFIGEVWKCIIQEVNPDRRNLIVSHLAYIRKEEQERRDQIMAELAVGQVREGLVRKLIPVGAFVDLGGVDGFIHISAMGWGRINKPEDVLKEGDRIRVKVTKIDTERNRISLSYKDESMDPWISISDKYKEGDQVQGKVSSLMPFGAFVEIAPGLEGLVHISEIAYARIPSVADALELGDVVNVKILSIDEGKRKMSLSIKQTMEDPRKAAREAEEAARSEEERKAEEESRKKSEEEKKASEERIKKLRKGSSKEPLKGGVNTKSEGARFGLNW